MLIREYTKNDFSVQVFHSCIVVSDIIDNQIIIKRYIDYTENEAIELFKNEYKRG